VLPIAQRMLVERQRWLTREQFLELLSVSQVLPGPNVVNLSLIVGDRFFGWRGAAFSLAGMIAAPTVIVLLLAVIAAHLRASTTVAGALHGMGIVAAGLILATAVKLMRGLMKNALGVAWCAAFVSATLLAVGIGRLPLAGVVLGLGSVSSFIAWRRIRR
jgi:chromate transporter